MENKDQVIQVVNKTWPDVASATLESLKAGLGDIAGVVGDISNTLIKSAPHIWNGLVAYHRALAIGDLFLNVVFISLSIVLFLYGKKMLMAAFNSDIEKSSWSDRKIAMFWSGIVMVVISIPIFCCNIYISCQKT